MKLELKHLAPYLPYALGCHCMGLLVDDYAETTMPKTVEIVGVGYFVEIYEIGRTVTEQYDISDVFPILRPLTDLTKEININGVKFIPLDRIDHEIKVTEITNDKLLLMLNGAVSIDFIHHIYHGVMEKLFEWHFDVFGLISEGLAIDINTTQL